MNHHKHQLACSMQSNTVMRRIFLSVTLATLLSGDLLALENKQHLLPIGPNFDTPAPYGARYAHICEKLLFPRRSWMIRYFEIIGDPPYDTGLTIYKKTDGNYWLMVRQARPEIKDIVVNAFYGRADLRSSLASIKIEERNRQIPEDIARVLQKAWLGLLQKTSKKSTVDDRYYIHPATVILFAKDQNGVQAGGKYPGDASRHRVFTLVEDIVDNLVKSCDATHKDSEKIFRRVAERARYLGEE
jgi:hypothetical protein